MFSAKPRRRSPLILGYLRLWLPPGGRNIGQHETFVMAIGAAPDAMGSQPFRPAARSCALAVPRTFLP